MSSSGNIKNVGLKTTEVKQPRFFEGETNKSVSPDKKEVSADGSASSPVHPDSDTDKVDPKVEELRRQLENAREEIASQKVEFQKALKRQKETTPAAFQPLKQIDEKYGMRQKMYPKGSGSSGRITNVNAFASNSTSPNSFSTSGSPPHATSGSPSRVNQYAPDTVGGTDPHHTQGVDGAPEIAVEEDAGFFRGLLEALEFLVGFISPFVHMLRLLIRVVKLAIWFISSEKRGQIDWWNEGIRALIDFGGIIFPPIGAVGTLGANIFFDNKGPNGESLGNGQSQIFGGLNEVWDDKPVKNYFLGLYRKITGKEATPPSKVKRTSDPHPVHYGYRGAGNYGQASDDMSRETMIARFGNEWDPIQQPPPIRVQNIGISGQPF